MSMSDPIADLLTRIRNALQACHDTIEIPGSKIKCEICRVLKEEGYISSYAFEEQPVPGVITVKLKYTKAKKPVIDGLRRISKPSLRVYARGNDVRQVRSGLGISIISTSQGIMTGRKARRSNTGGEVICEVW